MAVLILLPFWIAFHLLRLLVMLVLVIGAVAVVLCRMAYREIQRRHLERRRKEDALTEALARTQVSS
jgi:Flp pilus assembly protein TadB